MENHICRKKTIATSIMLFEQYLGLFALCESDLLLLWDWKKKYIQHKLLIEKLNMPEKKSMQI